MLLGIYAGEFWEWNMNLSLFASSLLQIGIFIAIVTFFIFVIYSINYYLSLFIKVVYFN